MDRGRRERVEPTKLIAGRALVPLCVNETLVIAERASLGGVPFGVRGK